MGRVVRYLTERKRAEIGRKGGLRTKERHGVEAYRRWGKKGAETTKKRYGKEHYARMARKRWEVYHRIMEAAYSKLARRRSVIHRIKIDTSGTKEYDNDRTKDA